MANEWRVEYKPIRKQGDEKSLAEKTLEELEKDHWKITQTHILPIEGVGASLVIVAYKPGPSRYEKEGLKSLSSE